MTKLENLVFSHPAWLVLGESADKKDKQRVLDDITERVLSNLSANEICKHVREVYDATAQEYIQNPHTQSVIDELIEFMNMLPDGAEVLDVGCGMGRDTFFMSIGDEGFRKSQMGRISNGKTTLEKFSVPDKTFKATGIDSSDAMLHLAMAKRDDLRKNKLLPEFSYENPFPHFAWADIHDIDQIELGHYDGIWSCAALFTHTPQILLFSAMESAARTFKPNGLFFVSYTNGRGEGRYNKLLLSSTGHIKYFSQPNPDEITEAASDCGLKLEKESFGDFEICGKVLKKDLFVSQFFKKA